MQFFFSAVHFKIFFFFSSRFLFYFVYHRILSFSFLSNIFFYIFHTFFTLHWVFLFMNRRIVNKKRPSRTRGDWGDGVARAGGRGINDVRLRGSVFYSTHEREPRTPFPTPNQTKPSRLDKVKEERKKRGASYRKKRKKEQKIRWADVNPHQQFSLWARTISEISLTRLRSSSEKGTPQSPPSAAGATGVPVSLSTSVIPRTR